jgi:hypothetical protein
MMANGVRAGEEDGVRQSVEPSNAEGSDLKHGNSERGQPLAAVLAGS